MAEKDIEQWLLDNDYRLWANGTSFKAVAAELCVAVWIVDNRYAKIRKRLRWCGRARKLDYVPKTYHRAQWAKLRKIAGPRLKRGARLLGVARELTNAGHTVSVYSLRHMNLAGLRWRDLDEPKGDAVLELCETPVPLRKKRKRKAVKS